mgnify:FL=1
MTKTIALVACVSKKGQPPKHARRLYNSAWFRKARSYAEGHADAWYVLSAKYGLVAPDQVIAPYDKTLNTMSASARRAWAEVVLADVENVLEYGDRIIILAGMKYRQYLVDPL